MRINNTNKYNFKGVLNNKFLLSGLEKIANHPATFGAGTSLLMSLTLRPLVIKNTPNVEKKNKEYSIANSISSGIIKFLAVEALALPVEKTILKIEKNPASFLNDKSINFFKKHGKNFDFMSQILKQSVSVITAIPKSVLAVSLIPLIKDGLFKEDKNKTSSEINFTGKPSEILTSVVKKYYENGKIQNFSEKHAASAKNITRNMIIFADTVLCGTSALNIKNNKKIAKKERNNLIYNNILSTGFSIFAGTLLDKIMQNKGNFAEKFKKANIDNPKLGKYTEGINILRPTLAFALVYYGILPVFSNFFAQIISNHVNKKGHKGNFISFTEFKKSIN